MAVTPAAAKPKNVLREVFIVSPLRFLNFINETDIPQMAPKLFSDDSGKLASQSTPKRGFRSNQLVWRADA
jgi:hypothetical protein